MRISDWSSDVCSSDLRIGQGAAVRAEAPWAGGEARRPSKSLRLVLLGLALAAAATLFAASNDRLSRFVEGVVAGWTADPAQAAKAAKQRAIAKLLTETETDPAAPAADGARKSGVSGKGGAVRLDLGGGRIITKKKNNTQE